MSNYYLIHTVNLCAVHVQRRDWRFGFNLALFFNCFEGAWFFFIVMEMKEEEKKIGYGEVIN